MDKPPLKAPFLPHPGYRKLLDVAPSAPSSSIEGAYREKHRQAEEAIPPDLERLTSVQDTYTILANPANRYPYDIGTFRYRF